jgi:hypothetical protein
MDIIKLKQYPEIMRIIRVAAPSYKKHKVFLGVYETLTLTGTYWNDGSRTSYTAVRIADCVSQGAPKFDPPQFGGPRVAPEIAIPDGIAIVSTETFCGKTATAGIYINHNTAAKLLPESIA